MRDPIQNNSPCAKEKSHYPTDRKDFIFALLMFVCTFLFVDGVFWGWFNLGLSVAFLLTWIAASCYLHRRDVKIGAYPILCGILFAGMTPIFFLTSNFPVRILSTGTMVLLSCVWFCALAGKKIPGDDLGLLAMWGGTFANTFRDTVPAVRSVFSAKGEKKKKILCALAGALCALPVLAVVIPLLIRSDAAFEGLTAGLFASLGTCFFQLLATVFLAPFCFGCIFSIRKRKADDRRCVSAKGAEPVFWAVCTGALCVLYIVYLFSQLAYFFSAFSGILPDGYVFSYAEYARRGFFELCGIAAINLAMLVLMLLFSKKKDGKLPVILRVHGTFLGVFTLLLIATSLSKMWMYIRNYSLTVLRLGTSAFLMFMAVVFVTGILRCYTDRVQIFQTALITASILLLVLGLGNINSMVARYNYNDYVQKGYRTIDVQYLSSFPEGIAYLEKLMDTDGVRTAAEDALQGMFYSVCKTDDWGEEIQYDDNGDFIPGKACTLSSSFNLAYRNAFSILQKYAETHPEFRPRSLYESQEETTETTVSWECD